MKTKHERLKEIEKLCRGFVYNRTAFLKRNHCSEKAIEADINETHVPDMSWLISELKSAWAREQGLREALEFYCRYGENTTITQWKDPGYTARQALSQYKDDEK